MTINDVAIALQRCYDTKIRIGFERNARGEVYLSGIRSESMDSQGIRRRERERIRSTDPATIVATIHKVIDLIEEQAAKESE